MLTQTEMCSPADGKRKPKGQNLCKVSTTIRKDRCMQYPCKDDKMIIPCHFLDDAYPRDEPEDDEKCRSNEEGDGDCKNDRASVLNGFDRICGVGGHGCGSSDHGRRSRHRRPFIDTCIKNTIRIAMLMLTTEEGIHRLNGRSRRRTAGQNPSSPLSSLPYYHSVLHRMVRAEREGWERKEAMTTLLPA